MENHVVGGTASTVGDFYVEIAGHGLRHIEVHAVVIYFKMRFIQTADGLVGRIAFIVGVGVGRPIKVFEIDVEQTAFRNGAIPAGTDNVRRQSDYVAQMHVDWLVASTCDPIDRYYFHGINRVIGLGVLPR